VSSLVGRVPILGQQPAPDVSLHALKEEVEVKEPDEKPSIGFC